MNNSFKLSKQLMWLITLSFVIVIISLGVALPRVITPVAEANLYNYLSEPLKFINNKLIIFVKTYKATIHDKCAVPKI